jgi:hypothetical protein
MSSLTQISYLGAVGIAAAALLLPASALAAHGKAGLWDITTKTQMPGVEMPDMSKMPPEVQARMKAMHMHMSDKGMQTQHCMTQAEVDQDKPPMHHNGCKLTSYKASGHSFTGDMACTGEFQGTGHMQVTYDSPEHYKGSVTMSGTGHGHPMNMHTSFEGHWVSANCGNVSH